MTGGSYQYGKIEICNFVAENIQTGSTILDVGAGCGTYRYYLGSHYNWEAVEVWQESVDALKQTYNKVYQEDIRKFEYTKDYDLIIFGDVLEHLTVEDAQKVLKEATKHAKHILIGVPYMYEQEAIYGNEAEVHLQPDLTHNNFKERYPGFNFIFGRFDIYGYYWR